MENYINIYGLLFAKTADGKLAFTGQIYDEQLQKFQSDINKATPQLNKEGKLPIDLLPEPLQNAISVEIVAALPETGEANKIYLVKNEGSDPVAYDASMWIDNSWASFNSLAEVMPPMYIGEGDEDFTQYAQFTGTPMYMFLQRLIYFMEGNDSSLVSWVYSSSLVDIGVVKWYQIVACKADYTFSVISITGDLSEYEIFVNGNTEPAGLRLLRTINIFKSTTSNTVKGIEVVQGTAPMQQDNILYIELEETTT